MPPIPDESHVYPDITPYWTVENACVEMAICGVIYFILYLYLDVVMPNEYGVAKHPLFFIKNLFESK